MENIELTPLFLLVLGALFKLLNFLGDKLFEFIKNKKILKKSNSKEIKQILDEIIEIDKRKKKIREKENERLLKNNKSILHNQDTSNSIITETINNTDVERFVIFNTHNGSGQPNYFKPYKVSHIQFDTINNNSTRAIKKYEDLHVDNIYTKMLLEIQKAPQGKVSLRVDEMQEGLLKTIYKKEKIKYAEVHFICTTPTGIIYTSLATTKDINNFSKYDFEIDLAISKLKAIFIGEKDRVLRDKLEHKHNMDELQSLYNRKIELNRKLSLNNYLEG